MVEVGNDTRIKTKRLSVTERIVPKLIGEFDGVKIDNYFLFWIKKLSKSSR